MICETKASNPSYSIGFSIGIKFGIIIEINCGIRWGIRGCDSILCIGNFDRSSNTSYAKSKPPGGDISRRDIHVSVTPIELTVE